MYCGVEFFVVCDLGYKCGVGVSIMGVFPFVVVGVCCGVECFVICGLG